MHQTKIHSTVISANNNVASTSSLISKVTKSKSRGPPFYLTVAVHPYLTKRTHCWFFMSTRCKLCCFDRWHESVTYKWHHKTPITTVNSYRNTLPGWSSFWTPITINILQRCLIVWDVFSQLSGGLLHAKITLTSFFGRFDMVFW